MKDVGSFLLCLILIISLQACAVKPGDENLSPAELKTAGNATLTQQQSVKSLYNHAGFAASTNKEEDLNANT